MKYFESSGLWFPADDPSNAVGGTLHYNSKGLNLTLLGSFREGWSPEEKRFPIIHGVVGENHYGTFVNLIDCFSKSMHINMAGVTSETITCGRAIIGNSLLSDGASDFETLDVNFSYLKDWVGITGINRSAFGVPDFSISYAKPERLSFPFGEKTLSLAFSATMSGGRDRAIIGEEIHMLVEPVDKHPPRDLGQDRIQVLQNLLTFATDNPNGIERITYRGSVDERGLHPEHHLIYDPIFRLLEEGTKSLHPTDMLFTFLDAQSEGLNIFQSWLDFTERHSSFCTIYFANLYSEPRYLDQKFARLMQAFTLLVASMGKFSEPTKLFLSDVEAVLRARFGDEERDLLNHIIPTCAEVEMPYHLLRLLGENADAMGRVIEDIPRFVKSVSDTLGFVERRVAGARPPLQGKDLYYAIQKIRMLTKIVVLKELGFSEKSVKALTERNNLLNYIKTL